MPAQIEAVVKGIMASNSSARQSEVKAWEEDILPCEHTLTLNQVPPYEVVATGQSAHLSLTDVVSHF